MQKIQLLPTTNNRAELVKPTTKYPCPPTPKITPGNPKLRLDYPLARSCYFPIISTQQVTKLLFAAGGSIT